MGGQSHNPYAFSSVNALSSNTHTAHVHVGCKHDRMYNKIHPLAKERLHHVFPILKIFMGYDEEDSDSNESDCDHCHVVDSAKPKIKTETPAF